MILKRFGQEIARLFKSHFAILQDRTSQFVVSLLSKNTSTRMSLRESAATHTQPDMERDAPLIQNVPSLGVSRCFHFNEQQIRHLRHELGFTVQRIENKMSARDRGRLHTVLREECHQHLSGEFERVVCSSWLSIPSARPLHSSSVLAVQPDAHEHTEKICVFARRRRDGNSDQQQHRMRPLQRTASTCCALPACNEYEDGALK